MLSLPSVATARHAARLRLTPECTSWYGHYLRTRDQLAWCRTCGFIPDTTTRGTPQPCSAWRGHNFDPHPAAAGLLCIVCGQTVTTD